MKLLVGAIIIGIATAGQAAAASGAFSLVIAKWAGFSNPRQPSECNDPRAICLDVIGDVHFVHARTVSGPPLPGSFVATTEFHTSPRKGVRFVLAVRSTSSGREAIKIGYALPGEDEACFNAERADALGIIKSPNLVRRGANYCFPLAW